MKLLCLGMAGLVWAQSSGEPFTLAWEHSVEKLRWEEDYRLGSEGLQLVEARVRGSGAGMEIPADAQFAGGYWRYRPKLAPLALLHLGRSLEVADYQLCRNGHCVEMASLIGAPSAARASVELWACPAAVP